MPPCAHPRMQNQVVPFMMNNNPGRPISADRVLRFDNVSATNAWLLANPERVVGGVHFQGTETLGACPPGFRNGTWVAGGGRGCTFYAPHLGKQH